jgi:hypothetical protein
MLPKKITKLLKEEGDEEGDIDFSILVPSQHRYSLNQTKKAGECLFHSFFVPLYSLGFVGIWVLKSGCTVTVGFLGFSVVWDLFILFD